MKITIVYDNEVKNVGLKRGHGFSALIEDVGMSPLLFDTGTDGHALLPMVYRLFAPVIAPHTNRR